MTRTKRAAARVFWMALVTVVVSALNIGYILGRWNGK